MGFYSIKSSLSLLLLMAYATHTPFLKAYHDDTPSFGQILLVSTATVAAIGGITWLAANALYETDEHLVNRAHNELTSAKHRYEPLINFVDNTCGAGTTAHTITEQELNPIAVYLQQHSMTNYISDAYSVKKALHNNEKELHHRINKHHEFEYTMLDRSMIQTAQATTHFTEHLGSLYDLLNPHESYFRLFNDELRIAQEYAKELEIVNAYIHDQYQQWFALKRLIMANARHSDTYPILSYVERIDRRIDTLNSNIRHAAYNYADRLYWVRSLRDTLASIKGFITADPAYAQEIRDQEYARLEREKQATLQQQLHVQQSTLYEMQRANELERQRINVEREKIRKEEPFNVYEFNVSVNTRSEY